MRVNTERPLRRRVVGGITIAVSAILVATMWPGSTATSAMSMQETLRLYDQAAADAHAMKEFKNSLWRGGEASGDTKPVSARAQARSEAYVESQRALPDPKLHPVSVKAPQFTYPRTRYEMARGCYVLALGDRYLTRTDAGAVALGGKTSKVSAMDDALHAFFQATDLGTYLLESSKADFLAATNGGVGFAEAPSTAAEWTVKREGGRRDGRFTFANGDGQSLAVASDGTVGLGDKAARLILRKVKGGCKAYPEIQTNIKGAPRAGETSYQEVRGYVDGHTHGMAFEFLGGMAHCGKPWDKYGAPYALVDCVDHTTTGGYGGVLEDFLSGEPGHDPVGWPTFKDWPAPHSLTHEGTYWKWLERSWRGGQRLFVNLLVENNQLCTIYPLKKNSCDDMDSIRLQASDMYKMQDYIDAQFGGPGRGFYRIVRNPFEARKVINAGRMAVVMGIETSVPFGCTFKNVPGVGDTPACSESDIDKSLNQMEKLGVRQMELVNKFDNALSGVAGDGGVIGPLVNGANFLETGTFWDMRHCEPKDGQSHDNNQDYFSNGDIPAEQQDALFGAIAQLSPLNLPALPVYPPPDHCNERGLTDLGAYLLSGMKKKGWLIDPDHMSVKARKSLMALMAAWQYPGVISSHSWSTPDTYPKIYKLGGFITPYAGDSTGFVDKWRQHVGWADPRYYFGIGYGADINGLGAQGDPRGADVSNPVTYPFTGLNGVIVNKEVSGKRVYDINVDGVAHYGLYPDWIQDLIMVAGDDGGAIRQDIERGAEAYLQTWERGVGIAADPCRNPDLRKSTAQFTSLISRGMTAKQVLEAVGQPWQRLDTTFTYCTKTAGDNRVETQIVLNRQGRVVAVKS